MQELRPREPVLFAEDFSSLVAWYEGALGFRVVQRHEDGYHYAKLVTDGGLQLGIADAGEMGVQLADRAAASLVLQCEVDDLAAFFAHVEGAGGSIVFGPNHDARDGFWFGSIADPEGNRCWVVDKDCP
jgi:predicted enzyme related to lactoylglutathione lyase